MIPADALLERFWAVMAQHLWQSTLVLGLLFLLALALRRAPASLRNALWLAALAKLLLPLPLLGPLVGRLAPGLGTWMASGGSGESAPAGVMVVVVRAVLDPAAATGSSAAAGAGNALLVTLTLLWAGGVCLVLLRWIREATLDRRMSSLGLAEADPATRARVEEALEGTGIPARRVLLGGDGRVPAAVGVLRPRILLPAEVIDALDTGELRAVLLHEDAHCRRRDPLLAHLQRLVQALFFFHPLLWPLLRRLGETTELACDERVLEAGVPPLTYRRALARVLRLGLEPAPAPAMARLGGRSFLRRRLEGLNESRRSPMKRHALVLTLGAALVAALSFFPLPAPAGEEPAPAPDAPPAVPTAASAAPPAPTGGEGKSEAPAPRKRQGRELPPGVFIAGIDGVGMPKIVPESRVQPYYPESARKDRIMGKVILEAIIDKKGEVGKVKILRSPETEGAEVLAEAAKDAVSQWRYEPATKDGKPVSVLFTIVIDFKLDNDGDSKAKEKKEEKDPGTPA